MRTTKETRERLEAAAVANGRSLVQEVEARIERSFQQEVALGSPAMAEVSFMMAASFAVAGQRAADGKANWTADLPAFVAGAAGVLDALLTACPAGEDANGKALAREALIGRLLSQREQDKEQDK